MAALALSAAIPAAAGTTSVVLRGHTSWVNAVAVGRDLSRLATGGNDGAVCLWDREGRLLHRVRLPRRPSPMGGDALLAHLGVPVNTLAFGPAGRWLAAGTGDGAIHLISVADGVLDDQLPEASGQVNALASLADGRLLAGGLDGCLTLWEVAGRRVIARTQLFHFPIQGIAVAPDGAAAAVCSMESRLKVVGLPDLATRRILKGHKDTVYAVAWSGDGRYLASGSNDRTARLWDLEEGGSQVIYHEDAPVYAVAFSPDGATLAVAPRGGTIHLLRVPEGEEIARLTGHTADVCALLFPAATMLVSASRDATARVWRLPPR